MRDPKTPICFQRDPRILGRTPYAAPRMFLRLDKEIDAVGRAGRELPSALAEAGAGT